MTYATLKACRETLGCQDGMVRVNRTVDTVWASGHPRRMNVYETRPLQADDWVIYPVPSWSGPLWLYEYQAHTCTR